MIVFFIYFTGIALVFFVAAAIADYLPWGRAEWVEVLAIWNLRAANLRYDIDRARRRQPIRRAHYRLLLTAARILGRILTGRAHIERTNRHDHR